MEAFGGMGFFAEKPDEFDLALNRAFANSRRGQASLINVMIDLTSERKKQDFMWLTRSKM